MTTKIAFTSSSDPLDATVQPVWNTIAGHEPDHLLLLGDTVYMDYFLGIGKNPSLGKPSEYSVEKFSKELHRRYQSQWEVFRQSDLWKLPLLEIHGIWDDHDFAWNNSFGDSGSNTSKDMSKDNDAVSCNKQRVSRKAMQDFFHALQNRAETYPSDPYADANSWAKIPLDQPMFCTSSQNQIVKLAEGVSLFLSDGRSFRTSQTSTHSTALGKEQIDSIGDLLGSGSILILACGSTISGSGESLDNYEDYKNLMDTITKRKGRVLACSGDIHKAAWRKHGLPVMPNDVSVGMPEFLYEAVASGAARPLVGTIEGCFGLLAIEVEHIQIDLYGDGSKLKKNLRVIRKDWTVVSK